MLLIISATNNESSVSSFQTPYNAVEWEGRVSGAKVGEGTAHRGKVMQRWGWGKGCCWQFRDRLASSWLEDSGRAGPLRCPAHTPSQGVLSTECVA